MEEFLLRYLRLTGRVKDENRVVAERAAKVASAGKNNAGYLAGIIDKREFV
jgi:hypothetical protein